MARESSRGYRGALDPATAGAVGPDARRDAGTGASSCGLDADAGADRPATSRTERLHELAAEMSSHTRPPVLADTPSLATLLDLVGLVDRVVAQALELLIELRTTGEVEAATGASVELWLQQVAKRTSADVRMLLAAAELLPRLPATRAAFLAGQLSWSQVRAVVLACRRLRVGALEQADARVQQWVWFASDARPESVTQGIERLAWEFDQAAERRRLEAEESRDRHREFVALQPRLDGSGGRIFGEAGAVNFALLDAALNDGVEVPAGNGDLLDRGDRSAQATSAGQQRAQRLFGWAADHLGAATGARDVGEDRTSASADGPEPRRRRSSVVGRSGLLVRMELSTLLGGGLPADLLTTLTGGRLRVSAGVARRLIDEGVDLRTVVVDESGSVVGVGRASRQAPGWLRDAVLSVNGGCTGPCCRSAARVAHLDHARPWWPTDPDDVGGTTDVANLAPLCVRQNGSKELDGWRVTGTADGGRVWRHQRSGIVYRHLPDHWPPTAVVEQLEDPYPRTSTEPPSRAGPDLVPPPDGTHHGTVADLLDPPDPDVPF